jgi:predicted RNA-binding protein YlqC (UPF0109 family)
MPSPLEFVQAVAKQLVDKPEEVHARWVDGPDGAGHVELTVNPSERGKIIGRRGRTIDSLRTLATEAFGQGKSVGVEVAE